MINPVRVLDKTCRERCRRRAGCVNHHTVRQLRIFAQRDKLKARIAKLRPARKRAAPMAGEALTCLDVDQRAALPAREHGAMRLDAANSSLTDRSRSRKNDSSRESAETGSPPDYSIRRGRWTGIKRRNRFEPDGELTIAPLAFSNPDDDEGRH